MSSVKSGLDGINLAIARCYKLSQNGKLNYDILIDSINTISDTVTSMNVVNVFMLETINRFLDFSKAQKGMKLVPKKETFDLNETLSLPVQCMQAIQTRIIIEDISISDEICSHIITDKQWLQENMICLLSNAVKYSSEGKITVTVTPINITDLPTKKNFQSNYIASKSEDTDEINNTNSSSSKNDNTPCKHPSVNSLSSNISPSINTPLLSTTSNTTNNTTTTIFKSQDMYYMPLNDSDKTSDIHSLNTNNRQRKSPTERFSLIYFQVQDTGIGISQEVMDDLFSPFKQAQRLAGGTGLGLYSLAKRIEAIGGYYGVRARDDGIQGSNFWFAIPYKADHVFSAHSKAVTTHTEDNIYKAIHLQTSSSSSCSTANIRKNYSSFAHTPRHSYVNLDALTSTRTMSIVSDNSLEDEDSISVISFQNLNILLVDDSLSILKMTGSLFRKHGHTVTEAVNGSEALKKLVTVRENSDMKPFDLMIMDLHMPVMDGKLVYFFLLIIVIIITN